MNIANGSLVYVVMNTNNQTEVKDKRHYYKTAKALIGCANFKKGDFVSVKYADQYQFGTHWYEVNGSTMYPEHHLTEFVL